MSSCGACHYLSELSTLTCTVYKYTYRTYKYTPPILYRYGTGTYWSLLKHGKNKQQIARKQATGSYVLASYNSYQARHEQTNIQGYQIYFYEVNVQ